MDKQSFSSNKRWKTAISAIIDGQPHIRGYKLADLVDKLTLTEVIFLELKGELPTGSQRQMMDAILISTVDNGLGPPSVTNARNSASSVNPMQASVAAGILGIGEAHGGAIEEAAHLLQMGYAAPVLVEKILGKGDRIPGYGHKVYDIDPRATQLLDKAQQLGFYGEYCTLAKEVGNELEKQKGKKIPLNVDGAIAAIVSDMGFDWRLGKGFFIIGRTVALVAHSFEETTREKPFRRISDEDIEYDGPNPRKLPR
ncbi:citryl-CoA lyase [Candidatus Daviesbacteria bacterium]|nr:citryl-CoA lyase [Candidatus Daviesbacteria bacterium]